MNSSIKGLLGSAFLPWGLAVFAFMVSLPSVRTGLMNDDYMQRMELLNPGPMHERLERVGLGVKDPGRLSMVLSRMFMAVAPGKNREQLRAYGALPWWTGRDYQVSLLRPVAALSHWLDVHVFGDSLVCMHVHNLLWLCAVVGLAAMLYRRFLGVGWIAGLAGLLYALEDGSYFPAAWIANRNQLMALAFGLCCIMAYDQWCRSHSLKAALVTHGCLVASLLCAEGGVATFAYLFAYAVCLDKGPWAGRLLRLVPAFVLLLVWRMGYDWAGYGARGGGFYFDPGKEPLAFVTAAWQRAPFLLAGQWLSLPPELFTFVHDQARSPYVVVLWVLCTVILMALWPLLRSSRQARFFLLGMLLSVVPICTAVPMARNLLFAAIGGFGLLALFIAGVVDQDTGWWPRTKGMRVIFGGMCVLLCLIHLPLAAVTRVAAPWITQEVTGEITATTDLDAFADINDCDMVIVNAPNPASLMYVPYMRVCHGQSLPQHILMLAPGYGPLQVTRMDPNCLTVRALQGDLLHGPRTSRLDVVHFYRYLSDFRGRAERNHVGDVVDCGPYRVRVTQVDQRGQPLEVHYTFNTPLNDISLFWLQWDWEKGRYTRFPPPLTGETRTLHGPFE